MRYLLAIGFIALASYEWLVMRTTQSYFDYLSNLCMSFLIISVLHHYSRRPFRALTWFAAINFSVFFLHTYVNAGLKILFAGGPARSIDIVGNVFYQIIYTALLVTISIAVCMLVKKLTGKYSKYLIGA